MALLRLYPYLLYSDEIVLNTIHINENYFGGGIYCEDSNVDIVNSKIINNHSVGNAGGLNIVNREDEFEINIINVQIAYNVSDDDGGGINISIQSPNVFLSNVNVLNNIAQFGGGISIKNKGIIFDEINRCNIYNNKATTFGNEFWIESPILETIILDTFTVLNPTNYQVGLQIGIEITDIEFDILTGLYEQFTTGILDIYVSPDGNNNNNGLTNSFPLQTINNALNRIQPDSLNPVNINLMDGVYSYDSNNEVFPLILNEDISLIGNSPSNTILDGINNNYNAITIIGFNFSGYIRNTIEYIHIKNFNYCEEPIINIWGSSPMFFRIAVTDNLVDTGWNENPIIFSEYSSPMIYQSTIANNTSFNSLGATIFIDDYSIIKIINTIIWNEYPDEFIHDNSGGILVLNSNIKGGLNNIDTTGFFIGLDEENLDTLPLFNNIIEQDYTLSNNSLCIDSGFADSNFTMTVYEESSGDSITISYELPVGYYGIAPDMGAFEWLPDSLNIDELPIPTEYILHPAFPNPFNPTTTITFSIPEPANVSIKVYDILGKEVAELVSEYMLTGNHQVRWRAEDKSTGVYFIKMNTMNINRTQKVFLIK